MAVYSITTTGGSSPLTRGKLRPTPSTPQPRRLIPAHAGKTRCSGHADFGRGAHPRSRGENHAILESRLIPSGSSPLTRGKRQVDPRAARRFGLIPAHAGKTPVFLEIPGKGTAHPRSRGENSRRGEECSHLHGSSPLTRGKLKRVLDLLHHTRLIPAHAGKTNFSRSPRKTRRAHPRSRGENALGGARTCW